MFLPNLIDGVFFCIEHCEPYYKSKLEMKAKSSEILPVNCKFICDSIPT